MACICEELRTGVKKELTLEDAPYTALMMGYGYLRAVGESEAISDIKYCPFCGKKFE